MIATGAQKIWNLRVEGVKPSEVVFISLIGPLNDGNFQVFLPQGQSIESLDWRWVVDLSVCIVYGQKTEQNTLARLTKTILRFAPNGGYLGGHNPAFGCLWLWDADKQDGSLAEWWQGLRGIPLIDLKGLPEAFDFNAMAATDKLSFSGVIRA